jgi:hypothetical protein
MSMPPQDNTLLALQARNMALSLVNAGLMRDCERANEAARDSSRELSELRARCLMAEAQTRSLQRKLDAVPDTAGPSAQPLGEDEMEGHDNVQALVEALRRAKERTQAAVAAAARGDESRSAAWSARSVQVEELLLRVEGQAATLRRVRAERDELCRALEGLRAPFGVVLSRTLLAQRVARVKGSS